MTKLSGWVSCRFSFLVTPIKLHYSESLVHGAVKAFWWRTTGWSFFITFGVLLACFIYEVWSGDRSWPVWVLGVVLCLTVAFAVALYFVHYRGSFTRFHRMRLPEATFEFGEDRFRITSDVGASELVWTGVAELWCFPDFWLLFVSRSQFITLPAADLDTASREFIISKLKSLAIKVA